MVGATGLGYMFIPADAAYSRLCFLKPSYKLLLGYFKRSLKEHNVLRSSLLARLLYREYANQFSDELYTMILNTDNLNKKIVLWRCAQEALLLTTVLRSYNNSDKCASTSSVTIKVDFLEKMIKTNALPEYFDVNTPFYGQLIGTNNYRINTKQYLGEIANDLKKGL